MKRGTFVEPGDKRAVSARLLAVLIGLILVAAACGDDEGADESEPNTETNAAADGDEGDADEGAGLPNACPADGCTVFITEAAAADSGEIELTFDANYSPEFERNHIHVFWDSQEPGAVSSDFDSNGYEVQGKWHPTDAYPTYVTEADASVTAQSRGESTTLCVTAADTDHAVIDPGLFACRDVSDLLS